MPNFNLNCLSLTKSPKPEASIRTKVVSNLKWFPENLKPKKPTKQNAQNVKRLKTATSTLQNQFEVLSSSEDDGNQKQIYSTPKNTPSTSNISVNQRNQKVPPITRLFH
ncbi:hypothetical protein NPIL_56071 [Nephila pilipes]|uniref:Uncharacterized protein n=1 Tax=Nephila pilipes TaxID=299642 RepID=A0A8X6NZW2_NEPPI|nr:hypothetical protein NPIL_56071 [Nephila pilipes]